ncbi:MAG: peptide chain release factor N(5)-glutamine methyltransferase [Myxococcota bacterium]
MSEERSEPAARPAGSGEGRVWTVMEVLDWTAGRFKRAGIDTPRLDAEVLLAHVLGCDRLRLYVEHDRPLNPDERARYRDLVRRRTAGEPAAYLIGEKEFYGRSFKVDRRVLIPRPETEHLVDAALEALRDEPAASTGEPMALDLGTGSGCIGITLAAELPGLRMVMVDLSQDACELAAENAERLGVAERVRILQGDLFSPVEREGAGPFSLIVSNPPYIASDEVAGLMRDVRDHEPSGALDSGPSGTEVLERIIREAPRFALPGASVILEHGEGQGEALLALVEADEHYEAARDIRDHAGLDRVFVAKVRPDAGPAE